MHPKRKTSNEKTAQFYAVAAKALRRLITHLEGFDTSELLPEHKKRRTGLYRNSTALDKPAG